MLRNFASFVILGIAVVLVLGELGINLAPIVASAGVVGVALGFGAQNLVKDFIAGIGIILEDQYGVGDVVDLGEASGTVEAVGLRITRLRDVHGVVWYARNGEILRVGNKSQGFAQVVDRHAGRARHRPRALPGGHAAGGRRDVRRRGLGRTSCSPPPESLGVEEVTAARRRHAGAGAQHQRRPVAGRPRTAAAAGRAVRRRGHPHAVAAAVPPPGRGSAEHARRPGPTGAPGESPTRPATFRDVFGVREFRALFSTLVLSSVGDELARVALTVLVYQRTDSPLLSARHLRASATCPGWSAGRCSPRSPTGCPATGCSSRPTPSARSWSRPWRSPARRWRSLLALLLLVSLGAPPFESARSALQADILDGDRYAVASSVTTVSVQVTQVVGFLLAGALVAVFSPSAALLFDAVTFALSACWLGPRLQRRPAPAAATETPSSYLQDRGRACGSSPGTRGCGRSSACSGWATCS